MKDSGDYVCRSSNRDNGTIKVHILNGKYNSHELFLVKYANMRDNVKVDAQCIHQRTIQILLRGTGDANPIFCHNLPRNIMKSKKI